MLSFDIRSLEHHAVAVDGSLAPDDPIWQEGDPVPSGPLRVTGRLSTAGAGRFYWHGRVEGDAEMPCRRCLVDARAHVTTEEHVIFVEAEDEEADDPDVYRLDPYARDIDLRPAVREQWLLSVPAFVLCRDDCKGLCPSCGADWNAGPCHCPPAESRDPRWDALRKLGSLSVDTEVTSEEPAQAARTRTKKKRKQG